MAYMRMNITMQRHELHWVSDGHSTCQILIITFVSYWSVINGTGQMHQDKREEKRIENGAET